MEIARDKYLDKLVRSEHNGLVKVVTGVKGAGKSYLLFHLFRRHLLDSGVKEDHIIAIALDDPANKSLRSAENLFSYVEQRIRDRELYYIFLDEVRLLEDFVYVLNGFLHMGNTDVYVTGSHARFLTKDVLTEFRGRGKEIHVLPLSFREFITACEGEAEEVWKDYVNYGGIPQAVSLEGPSAKEASLSSLFQEVCLADSMACHMVRNPDAFQEMICFLATSVGSLTSSLELANTFKEEKHKRISDVTVSRYIETLEDAFIISRAARYDIRKGRYIGSPSKFYFEDTGLRNAALRFQKIDGAQLMENILYNELRCRDYSVDVGVLDRYGDDPQGKTTRRREEVSFIASKGNLKYYVQSLFRFSDPDMVRRAIEPLRHVPDNFGKIIVVGGDRNPRMNEDGFLIVGVREFLLDEKIL